MLHSSLRNVIERSFEVLKKRWNILNHMPPFSYKKQVKIVVAAIVVHNFIVDQGLQDEILFAFQDEEVQVNNDQPTMHEDDEASVPNDTLMRVIRDRIRDEIASSC